MACAPPRGPPPLPCRPTCSTSRPPHTLHLAAAATSAVGVVLGERLLVTLKPLADATSATAAARRAPRALAAASSPVAALLTASKAASKSYKAACTLGPVARLPKLPSDKRLKAAFAVASLLPLATAALLIPATSPSGVVVLAVLKSGYKLSKNTSKVESSLLVLATSMTRLYSSSQRRVERDLGPSPPTYRHPPAADPLLPAHDVHPTRPNPQVCKPHSHPPIKPHATTQPKIPVWPRPTSRATPP
jgi:hypothetical protein